MPTLTLIVLRHGESPLYGAPRDHARTLNDRGRAQARAAAEALDAAGLRPVRVMCSDSQRTRQTWAEAQAALPPAEVTFAPRLYDADLVDMRGAIEALEGCEIGMLVGHNPGASEIVRWLSGEGVLMGTGMAVVMTCEAADWAIAAQTRDGWRLTKIIDPDRA